MWKRIINLYIFNAYYDVYTRTDPHTTPTSRV